MNIINRCQNNRKTAVVRKVQLLQFIFIIFVGATVGSMTSLDERHKADDELPQKSTNLLRRMRTKRNNRNLPINQNCFLKIEPENSKIFQCNVIYEDNTKIYNRSVSRSESRVRHEHFVLNVSRQWRAPHDVKEIRLWHQNLYGIESGAFLEYQKSLQILHMEHNFISYVSSSAFEGLSSLMELNLSFNKLQSLPNDVFSSLVNLRSLNLAHNELQVVRNGVFCGLDSLIDLNLNKNLITEVEENVFVPFSSQETLVINIGHNLLTEPKVEWLKHGNNTSCGIFVNNSASQGQQTRFLRAEDNPWNCNCLSSERSIGFVQTLRNLSNLNDGDVWLVDMPCVDPIALQGVNIGGQESILQNLIENTCCSIPHDILLSYGVSDHLEATCDAINNENHGFVLTEANVTVIGIFIVILIPILLTLSPDCRGSGVPVAPNSSSSGTVSGGRFGITVNNNNNKTDVVISDDDETQSCKSLVVEIASK